MILVRAPLRISFLGGGTDLPDFYRRSPGMVISSTIDKYVHILINATPLVDKVTVKYQKTELVDRPEDVEHTRVRAALMHLGIGKGIEIGSFGDLPAKIGLGSPSSFSVALIRGLYAFMNKKLGKEESAEMAFRLENTFLGETVGKQDQYAAAMGGFNTFQFNQDDSVTVKPLLLDYTKRLGLEDHLLVFFTGIEPEASLGFQQKANIDDHFETLQEMAKLVPRFSHAVMAGNFIELGNLLHEGWLCKKSLAENISNTTLDELYEAARSGGAFGGKVLGIGGGGCVFFLVPPEKKVQVRGALAEVAQSRALRGFREIPAKFVHGGAEIIFNDDRKIA